MNIDDFFLRSSGKEGIEGVFRNLKGKVILQFDKEVSMESAVHVDVLALWEGLLVVAVSRWASSHSFMFEFDF